MAIAHLLEDFSPPLAEDGPAKMMSAVALEDQRLLSFEQGYSAGWDDAISAQTQDQKQASLALARTLEDASFTYHEALSQFSSSVEPLFTALFERVLPKIMHETVGLQLAQQFAELAEDRAAQPIVLTVAAGAGEFLSAGQLPSGTVAFEVMEDQSLLPGQAILRAGKCEHQIDSANLLEAVQAPIMGYFHQMQSEAKHG